MTTYAINQALTYTGPRPEKDAPSWMSSPVMFRRDAGFGAAEVFTANGSQLVSFAYITPRLAP